MSSKTSHTPAAPSTASESEGCEAAAKRPPDQLWSPLFVLIVAATLCCFMTGQGINSGTSVFIALTGGTAMFSGILAAVFSIASGAARFVCGPLVDSIGRLRVMMAGMVLMTLGTLIPALVANDFVFIACRVVQGVGFSAATTASATAAADILPLSRLGEGIGYYGLGQALAMSMGPALALFLVNTNPATNLYLGLAGVAAVGVALAACCRYEKNPQKLPHTSTYRRRFERQQCAAEAASNPVATTSGSNPHAAVSASNPATTASEEEARKPASGQQASTTAPPQERGWRRAFEVKALPGALPLLVLSPAFGFSIFFAGLYGTSLGIENVGLFYTLSAVSMILVRLKSRSFMDRVAPIKILAVSTICGLVSFALLLGAGLSEISFYTAGFIYGACLGISVPLSQAVAVKNSPPERWGAASALFALAPDVGIGVSALLWGFINDTAGFAVTICCCMVCIAASYVVAWRVYPKEKSRR